MFKKIEAAVTQALQQAQASGSTDPSQTIQDAIAKVFQDQSGTQATTDATAQQASTAFQSFPPGVAVNTTA